MKRRDQSNTVELDEAGDASVAAYSQALPAEFEAICDRLRELISKALPKATAKVWHGSPVWFMEQNPVVGYNATAKGVHLLFWNGQAFDDPMLKPVGKHRAAQASYKDANELDRKIVQGWLKKAGTDILDSQAYFKKLRESKKEKK
jgi:hypothetical protein